MRVKQTNKHSESWRIYFTVHYFCTSRARAILRANAFHFHFFSAVRCMQIMQYLHAACGGGGVCTFLCKHCNFFTSHQKERAIFLHINRFVARAPRWMHTSKVKCAKNSNKNFTRYRGKYTRLLLRGHFLPNRGHTNKIVKFWPEIKNLCYNHILWPMSINEIFFAMKW